MKIVLDRTRAGCYGFNMKLHTPFLITPRLMAGVNINGTFLSIGNGPRNADGRTRYGVFIDLPDGTEHEVTDLQSGCGGGGVRDGMENLLGFLGAAAESYSYRQRTGRQGENEDLFPAKIVEWAAQNDDEISMTRLEIEENPGCVED